MSGRHPPEACFGQPARILRKNADRAYSTVSLRTTSETPFTSHKKPRPSHEYESSFLRSPEKGIKFAEATALFSLVLGVVKVHRTGWGEKKVNERHSGGMISRLWQKREDR